MGPDHCEMMQTSMDYLVYLIQINKGFRWQINLFFLTAQIVQWAVENGVIVCVWKIRSSVCFGPRPFGNKLHIFGIFCFHSCQYGSLRQKKTMFAFTIAEFHANQCHLQGQNSKHKHAAWGYNRKTKSFATAEETAYPMGLSKMIAMVIVRCLIRMGIKTNLETLDAIQPVSLQALQKMRAATGTQSRSSKTPTPVPPIRHVLGWLDVKMTFLKYISFNGCVMMSPFPQIQCKFYPKGPNSLQLPRLTTWTRGMTNFCSRRSSGLVRLLETTCPNFCRRGAFLGNQSSWLMKWKKQATLWTWAPSCRRDSKRCWRVTSTKIVTKGTAKGCRQ